ncbi:MAG: hypothetical protein OXH57_05700 [Ekhidna sp.]|nr:hypothetical protein [Ekhidna sp.]
MGYKKEYKSLKLLPTVFGKLHDELVRAFSEENAVNAELILSYQLYGFDNMDDNKPNLRDYIRIKTGLHINGKYLYNKVREWNSNKIIKLTREYVYVYFNCIGFKGITEFLDYYEFDSSVRNEQLKLIGINPFTDIDNEYYVGYYYGEDREVIKTKLSIYNQYKNVDWTLIYWEDEDTPSLYTYKGVVIEAKDTITFYFSKDFATTERDALISVFFGNRNIVNKPFLLGTYSGFDRSDHPVAGKIIFEKVLTEEEQEEQAHSKEIDIIIRNEITNQRLVVNSTLPQNKFELSEESLTANKIENYAHSYIGCILNSNNHLATNVYLKIEKDSNKASLKIFDSKTHFGFFKILHAREILYGLFDDPGNRSRLILIIDSSFYNEKYLLGTYSGVGPNNRPIVGRICFEKKEVDIHLEERGKNTYLDGQSPPDQQFLYHFFLGSGNNFGPTIANLKEIEKKLTNNSNNETGLKLLAGKYLLYYVDEQEGFLYQEVMEIQENGDTILTTFYGFMLGSAKIFGDGQLAVRINKHGDNIFYAQLMVFVGRYSHEEAKALNGIFSTLSNDYSPIAYKVVVIPTNSEILPQRIKIGSSQYKEFVKSDNFQSLFNGKLQSMKSGRS